MAVCGADEPGGPRFDSLRRNQPGVRISASESSSVREANGNRTRGLRLPFRMAATKVDRTNRS